MQRVLSAIAEHLVQYVLLYMLNTVSLSFTLNATFTLCRN